MKRLIVVSMLVMVIIALIVGCAKSPSTPTSNPAPAPVTPTSATAQAPGPTITLKWTQSTGEREHDAVRYFTNLVTERSNGRIKFDIIWGGALTKTGEEVEATGRGLADMTTVSTASSPEKFILSNVTYVVPFNTRDPRLMLQIGDKLFKEIPEMDAEFEKYNVKRLFNTPFASYEMQSMLPVKSLADLKGLKVACIGSTMPGWFETIGAVPIAMGVPDRYSAFQTGMIKAEVFPLKFGESFKWTDLAKYVTIVGMGTNLSLAPAVNIDVWNKFSPADQQLILDASKNAADWWVNISVEDEAKLRDDWEKNLGITFFELPQADKAAWCDKLKGLPYAWAKEWDAKGYPATKTLDALLRLSKEAGYTYPIEFTK
jgi:TRAP-type C4-dicarboxylate transport system substrate-binding protein